MKNFDYASPTTEAEVLSSLLAEPGETELIAGGTDLVGLMKKMIITPERVVNLLDVPVAEDHRAARRRRGRDRGHRHARRCSWSIPISIPIPPSGRRSTASAACRSSARGRSAAKSSSGPSAGSSATAAACWPPAARWSKKATTAITPSWATRARPSSSRASRIAPALIALGATARVIGPDGRRTRQFIPVESSSACRGTKASEKTRSPAASSSRTSCCPSRRSFANATYEVRHGEGPDYPLASAAASLRIEGGIVREARIVLGHVAPTPWISTKPPPPSPAGRSTSKPAEAAGLAAVAAARPFQQRVQSATRQGRRQTRDPACRRPGNGRILAMPMISNTTTSFPRSPARLASTCGTSRCTCTARSGRRSRPTESNAGACWCNNTQHSLGPDRDYVNRHSCVSGRECYRETY